MFDYDNHKLEIYSLDNATSPELVKIIEKEADIPFLVTYLEFNDDYCFVICDDYIDILDLSNLTIINSYYVDDQLLEEEYGHFIYGVIGKTKLFVARETNKYGFTLFVIDITSIRNLDVWIPFWSPTSPVAIAPMIYGLIICSCLLTSMFLKKIAQRKGKNR